MTASPFSSSDRHTVYRVCTSEEVGPTLSSIEVEAADDAEAIWIASAFSALLPVTLWHGERFLGCFGGPRQGTEGRNAHTLR